MEIPRPIGALIGIAVGIGVMAGVVALIIPPFIDQTNQFVDDVPGIVDELRVQVATSRAPDPGEIADRVQDFADKLRRRPGPADRARSPRSASAWRASWPR